MKNLLKIAPLALLFLSSCLKDELYTADTNEAPSIVEFKDAPDETASAETLYGVTTKSFPVVASDAFDVAIVYSGDDVAPQDITVGISVDPKIIEEYNAKIVKDAREAAIEHGEDPDEAEADVQDELFDLIPSNIFSLSSNTVTIKKGEKMATLTVNVKPDQFDFAYRYGLPLRISSVSSGTIGLNFGSIIYSVGAKNQYDGTYTVNGSVVRGGDPVLSGDFPEQTYELITVDANTVRMNRVAVWATGSNIGGIGGFYFRIDPVTNEVTVYDVLNPGVRNNPADPNYYDPATKTLYMSAYWGTGPTNRAWKATFQYEGERP